VFEHDEHASKGGGPHKELNSAFIGLTLEKTFPSKLAYFGNALTKKRVLYNTTGGRLAGADVAMKPRKTVFLHHNFKP